MANKKGIGLMMVWADMPAAIEEDFNRWYNEEHLPEVLSVPGVLNASRYEATMSGPKHLAVYELEGPEVVDTEAFAGRPVTEWGKRCSPRLHATNFILNVYEMIHPTALTDEIANSDMAPALQIGRMSISAEHEEDWNRWYTGVYVPNYEKVPGVIRGRRWKIYRGEPAYGVVYEFEHEKVSESTEWLAQREIHPDNERMRNLMTHASGSPGIWKKTFQL